MRQCKAGTPAIVAGCDTGATRWQERGTAQKHCATVVAPFLMQEQVGQHALA